MEQKIQMYKESQKQNPEEQELLKIGRRELPVKSLKGVAKRKRKKKKKWEKTTTSNAGKWQGGGAGKMGFNGPERKTGCRGLKNEWNVKN